MRLLFIHGAGGYDGDQTIVAGLRTALGAPVDMPQLSSDDMSVEAWASPVRQHLAELTADDVVIGHSFGATILSHVLAEREWAPHKALLLAMPDWSGAGWDVADYAFDDREPRTPLSLHHCRDDAVVPFEHLALNAARLPAARVVEHATGGHQFDGLSVVIAEDVRGPG